jgi:pyruvate dehydrogenase E2 component (dihydrolipoamide acetyltransferase)
MSFEFRLPDIGEGVVDGEIVRWLVREGDTLREDQPMVEVMTDKATVEIPSPKGGKVAKIHVGEGKICKVGQVMITLDDPAGASAGNGNGGAAHHGAAPIAAPIPPVVTAPKAPAPVAAAVAPAAPVAPAAAPAPSGSAREVLATPAIRKLARELGVDLTGVTPTGPNGRVSTEDVRAAAGQPQAEARGGTALSAPAASPAIVAPPLVAPAQGEIQERIPLRGLRRAIAQNMALSKQRAAHFTYVEECDMTALVALRKRAAKAGEAAGVKLSYLPFIVKAVVAGLKKFPMMNATLDDAAGEIIYKRYYHVGVATATEQGLMVPVVRDADRRSIFDIAREIERVSAAARTGKAKREEVTGSTFTISSLGALGGVLATPIINYPEVAIMGVHKIKRTPVFDDAGEIVARDLMNLSVSIDHRVVDGYEGAMFLQEVVRLLGDPAMMMLELA